MAIVLGIDPGMAILGWGVIDTSRSQPQLIKYGTLQTPAHTPLTSRLTQIFSDLQNLFETYRPAHVAIETLFFVKNAKTIAQVGHVRGVVLLAAGQAGANVFEYTPRQIKMALTGFGGAEKHQMQMMVKRVFRIAEMPQPDDAADAVAVALCHSQYAQSMGKSAVTV